MKLIFFLALTILVKGASAQSLEIQNDNEWDIWFSQSQNFPMNQVVCINGECTPGGLKKYQIALTFDDGPNGNTVSILNTLRKYRIPATFFVTLGPKNYGKNAQSYLKMIRKAGHHIANHGSQHSLLQKSLTAETTAKYLMETHEVIAPFLNRNDLWLYRNPGGFWSTSRANSLNKHPVLQNYVGPIFWNVGGAIVKSGGRVVDAADWQCQSRGVSAANCALGYYRKIIANYKNNSGSLVLMHDIHPVTTEMLPLLLEQLAQTALPWEFIFVQDIPAVQMKITET